MAAPNGMKRPNGPYVLSFALPITPYGTMKFRTLAVLALCWAMAGISCKKDQKSTLEGDWLFPIAKGSFSLNSLNMFRHITYDMEVHPADIDQAEGIPVSSPGLYFAHLGPAEVPVTGCLARLDVDTLNFSGTFTNNFPVAVSAGTRFVMRTTTDTSTATTIAGFATVDEDILPGSSYSFSVAVSDKILGDHVYLYLENFKTPAFSNLVFGSSPSRLTVQINILTASYAEVFTNRECTSEDTTEFSVGANDHNNGIPCDTCMSGIINVFADNGLPASASSQLYFLNADKTKALDSLFPDGPLILSAGTTSSDGATTDTVSAYVQIPISKSKLERMKQSYYVASRLYLSTMGMTGMTRSVNRDAALVIQLTGDLRLKLRF